MADPIKTAVVALSEQRDRARDLAVTLENELETALDLIQQLNRRIAVLEGREIEG